MLYRKLLCHNDTNSSLSKVAAILSGFLPKIRFQTIRHKKPAAFYKETERKKTDLQQKQAADAIYIYYGEETGREDKNVLSKTNNKIISSKNADLYP